MTAPFHAAIRAALGESTDAYRASIAIFADYLEEQGNPESERLRKMLPACEWAHARGILLTECELVEGEPWCVYRSDGAINEMTVDHIKEPTEYERISRRLLGTMIVHQYGFGGELRQPCEGVYLGKWGIIGRIGGIEAAVDGALVVTPSEPMDLRAGWNAERIESITAPRPMAIDSIRSLVIAAGEMVRAVRHAPTYRQVDFSQLQLR
jgi:hypothetical protein